MFNGPRFVVVGHPNKGKSSIVSTLAHHAGIAISDLSGTTEHSQSFPFILDGKTIYELFDTPGFQRPRQVLSWIENYAKDASQRLLAINAFIRTHKESVKIDGRFNDEIELLSPILEHNAGIIYVVDGSIPYTPEYEAEMTILQWTGQPRMALINPISGNDYVEQWTQALGQYFSMVKVFNPMQANIEKQLSILSAFSELHSDWQDVLIQSIDDIKSGSIRRTQQSAFILAQCVSDLIQFEKSMPLPSLAMKDACELSLKSAYQAKLRDMEKAMRQRILDLYSHQGMECQVSDLSDILNDSYPDLFDQDYWYLFGLTRKKLVSLSVSAGAATGAAVDLGVGGASFMTAALLGGILSGSTSLFLSREPDKISIKGIPLGGKKLCVGPVKNVQFAFVLLGRALAHHRGISSRTHADRRELIVDDIGSEQWVSVLNQKDQVTLSRLLIKASKGLSTKDIQRFQECIFKILDVNDA